jgi:glyoxylase-like metal-dependent hydrolase (beta-lactamase superfamily II)
MSEYDGVVSPAGPSGVRRAGPLIIRKASVGSMDNNAYLLTCDATGEQLLVDAADDVERLQALVDEGTGQLGWVCTTHRHWDHHRALADLVERTGASTAAGAQDADALPVSPDRRLEHGDVLQLGDVRLEVIALRGHTPGSIALLFDEPGGRPHLFTGDSLFPGGPGRTTSPAEFTSLMDDLDERVFGRLPDDTWVYPGHGNDTTLGAERPHLSEWRVRGW